MGRLIGFVCIFAKSLMAFSAKCRPIGGISAAISITATAYHSIIATSSLLTINSSSVRTNASQRWFTTTEDYALIKQ